MTADDTTNECSYWRGRLSRNYPICGRLVASLRASRATAAITLVLSLLFLELCCRPIWHTDVWGHLSYGRYIWENRSIPATEPLLPYSRGVPFIDGPWLSQLIGFALIATPRLQLAGLQGLFAVAVTACGALLSFRVLRQTKHFVFALLALWIFVMPCWNCILILRPQLAGLLCFVFVLTRLSQPTVKNWEWYSVPVVFLLWANLHPSFPVGVGLLSCFGLGRATDLFLRTRSFKAWVRDHRVRQLMTLTSASAVAALVNPYGFRQFEEVLRASANPNLHDLTEWQALSIRDTPGQAFAASVVILSLLFRFTPRRIRSWEVLASVGLGLAAMWSVRMLVWWVPVCCLLVSQHAFSTWRKWRSGPLVTESPTPSYRWSLVSFAVVTTCFVASPLGQAVILNHHCERFRSVTSFTPLFAATYLSEHPPTGMVFATYEWSDYLQWAGPPDLKLLLNSHAHLIPREVWMAYMQVIELRNGWKEALDRFGINTIVVDRANRTALISALDQDVTWKRLTEERDGQALFGRRQPLPERKWLNSLDRVDP